MAQDLTVAMSNPFGDCKAGDNKITLTWQSAAAGTVSYGICTQFIATRSPPAIRPTKIQGYIVKVDTNPDDTDAPTDNYDINLLNSDSIDVASGNLVNRDTANSEQWIPSDPPYVDSELTLTIANAGDTKKGVVTIWMRNQR